VGTNVLDSPDADVPLCIDCDGTLIRTDLMHECIFALIKRAPWRAPLMFSWVLSGKAVFKQRVAENATFDWIHLPFNERVLELARDARAQGRWVVLATAAHHSIAEALAQHLGLFDEVIATRDENLSGDAKRRALELRFGERGFDYVGNSSSDLVVWQGARRSIVVSGDAALRRRAQNIAQVSEVAPVTKHRRWPLLAAMRPHQWLKNLLVFVPLIGAHALTQDDVALRAVMAFIAFSFCASSVYLLNDLLDLDADRKHERKRRRPFASGDASLMDGAMLGPVLLLIAYAIAATLGAAFVAALTAYFVTTLLYSFWLKRQVIVDVLLLAGLYTARVIAGSAATNIDPSFWLLAFSMFLFVSLALVKRYSELRASLSKAATGLPGRGYRSDDLPVLMAAGTACGMVSVLVFALYVNSAELNPLYRSPRLLWLVLPLLLYWTTRVWMKAHRGEVHDDPVVFAARDWQSLTIVALSAAFFILATHVAI
jgi:4-hydroxybenzoate polyprenyltransferase